MTLNPVLFCPLVVITSNTRFKKNEKTFFIVHPRAS